MANLVKVKFYGIILFLILLAFSYALFDSEHNKNLRFKQWHPDSTLYLTDFMKSEPIFGWDGFDATIVTQILIRETETGVPIAYAAMDRFNSWYNEKNHSAHLLSHEVYHANITSIGVNMLNEKIQANNLSYSEALIERDRIVQLISSKQKEYDRITNHSLNKELQHYWEYKIDSTLNYGVVLDTIDVFSGASAYFPKQPDIFIQKDTFMLFRVFELEDYEMKFRFFTKYDQYVDTTDYEDRFVEFLSSLNFQNISSRTTEYKGLPMVETHSTDTVNNRRFHDRLIYDGTHEYQLTVYHPLSTEDNSIYQNLTTRFFESFALKDLSSFWREKYVNSTPKEIKDVTVADGEKGDFRTLTYLSYSDCSIAYHKPFRVENEIIIPFKSEKHRIEDIEEVLVIINNDKILTQKVDSTFQLVHINIEELNKSLNKIQFGYIAKSDSLKKTFHIYSSIIQEFKIANSH